MYSGRGSNAYGQQSYSGQYGQNVSLFAERLYFVFVLFVTLTVLLIKWVFAKCSFLFFSCGKMHVVLIAWVDLFY